MTAEAKHVAEDKSLIVACLAALVAILAPFLSDSYAPSMPAITKALGTSANVIQLTMSLYMLGASFAQLFYGPFSEKFGRKPVILFGLITAVFGSLLCGLSFAPWFLLFGRIVQGIGAGACNAMFRALMRDQFSGAKLAQVGSYIGMLYTIVFAIAPIVGGYFQMALGWRANFLLSFALVSIVVFLIIRLLPETNRALNPIATQWHQIKKNYRLLLMSFTFVGYALMASLALSFFVCYYTSGPFLLENVVGLTPVEFGWGSLLASLGGLLGMLANARLVIRLGIPKMMFVGIIILTSTCTIMLLFGLFGVLNAWVILIPLVFISMGAGMIFSNAMASAFQPFAHIAGYAGAVYGCLQMLGSVIASALLALLHEETQIPLSLIFLGLAISIGCIFYYLQKQEKRIAN